MKITCLVLACFAWSGYGRTSELGSHGPLDIAEEPSKTLAAYLLVNSPLKPSTVKKSMQRSMPLAMANLDRRDVFQTAAAAGVGAATLGAAPAKAPAFALNTIDDPDWEVVKLPFIKDEDDDKPPIIFDVAFDNADPQTGIVVGSKATSLLTKDGGKTWSAARFADLDPDEEINYRFTSVSCKDGEWWIVGKPPILLHSRDGAKSWERIPLNTKLPGDPALIVATGNAESWLATSTGAIYKTTNAGRNYIAQVKEAIDATLNRVSSEGVQGGSFYSGSVQSLKRDINGNYIAVSSRGNFYLTWAPGQDFWLPHNRLSSRRISTMGFVEDDINKGVWMAAAGGEISKAPVVDTNLLDIPFNRVPLRGGGQGILDVAYIKDSNVAFACGGSGTLYKSKDGGKKWVKNEAVDGLATNLYQLKEAGGSVYALGSGGYFLRYKKDFKA